MRVVFLGTPQFAVPSLERLISAGHHVIAVFTQPDRPKGRGREVGVSAVKQAALRHGIAVHQPLRIRHPEVIELLTALRAEALVVVGYGQIIPQAIIDLPPHGIINVHASLLPKYRGAAPIQWAIANGEQSTGVTTMRIDAGLDTGDMLLKAATPIVFDEDAIQLSERLSVVGADLLVQTLSGLQAGTVVPQSQNEAEATYAPLLKKEDGRVDWSRPAVEIYNRCRGFLPWPGAYTFFRGQLLHIWKAKPAIPIELSPQGLMYAAGRKLLAACGNGTALELVEVQLEGRKRVSADAFRNGQHLAGPELLGEKTT